MNKTTRQFLVYLLAFLAAVAGLLCAINGKPSTSNTAFALANTFFSVVFFKKMYDNAQKD